MIEPSIQPISLHLSQAGSQLAGQRSAVLLCHLCPELSGLGSKHSSSSAARGLVSSAGIPQNQSNRERGASLMSDSALTDPSHKAKNPPTPPAKKRSINQFIYKHF